MGRKKPTSDQIVNQLQEIEDLLGNGKKIGEACTQLGISAQTVITHPPAIRADLSGSSQSCDDGLEWSLTAQPCRIGNGSDGAISFCGPH